jgi:ABC-type bacteriocin/lantibiotic exporter with double-glycine peptidase domain
VLTYEGLRPEQADARAIGDRVALLRLEDVFAGSIFENVAVGRLEVSPFAAREALARVGLLEAVLALEGGLQATLSPTGAPLSLGQVQLLLVARALVSSPRLVVVDLPLDALAPTARAAALGALTDEAAPWSLLLLTGDAKGPSAAACGAQRPLSKLHGGET